MKKNSLKTLLAVAIIAMAVFSVVQITDSENSSADSSGMTGGLYWSYVTATGTLTITGTGPMPDYTTGYPDTNPPPWKSFGTNIKNVIIGEGITTLGTAPFFFNTGISNVQLPSTLTDIPSAAFLNCKFLKAIAIPNSVATVGYGAFSGCESLEWISLPDNVSFIIAFSPPFVNTILNTVVITASPNTSGGVLATCFSDWALPGLNYGMYSYRSISKLVIDTADEVDLSAVAVLDGKTLVIEDKSINTVGGSLYLQDGTTELTGADRAGKTYLANKPSSNWLTTKTVTVSFDLGDGVFMSSQTVAWGAFITLPSVPYWLVPSSEAFNGWASDHSPLLMAGEKYYPSDDVTLHAIWGHEGYISQSSGPWYKATFDLPVWLAAIISVIAIVMIGFLLRDFMEG